MPSGFLPIDKPVGLRSSRCVEQVKKIMGSGVKVGHGGTLDSTASGVLVLLIGAATRMSNFIMMTPKIYTATVRLGSETSTCDYSGETTDSRYPGDVRMSDIDGIIPNFLGWRMQTPPEVSAVHVSGRRAHEIFRAGGAPEIKPRPVFIESIKRTSAISEEGDVTLLIHCGKGTYVRAIARDIGRSLGCFAHISSLRRDAVGYFSSASALKYGDDLSVSRDDLLSAICPIETMECFLPCYSVGETDAARLFNGICVPLSGALRRTCGNRAPDGVVMAGSRGKVSVGSLKSANGVLFITPEINVGTEDILSETVR
jgi:tRNA pseudouridine(55) synthase